MKCQFDAFADYVAEAEMHGSADYPLYEVDPSGIISLNKKPVKSAGRNDHEKATGAPVTCNDGDSRNRLGCIATRDNAAGERRWRR
jgi:hypothetical protein